MHDLKGKSVLITGASTGIGAAAARAFGSYGANVAIHYNQSKEAAEAVAQDVRALGVNADHRRRRRCATRRRSTRRVARS